MCETQPLLPPAAAQQPRLVHEAVPLATASLAALLTCALLHDNVVVCLVLQDLQH
jgi:hypothetical protein